MNNGQKISNPLKSLQDKCFLTCQIEKTTQGFDVFVRSGDPVAWLNEKHREAFGDPRAPLVKEVQTAKDSELMLLSGGVFLEQDGSAFCLIRDNGAPSYAGHACEPCGRAEELSPLSVCLNELNEELLLVCESSHGQKEVLYFVDRSISREEQEKRMQEKMDRTRSIIGDGEGLSIRPIEDSEYKSKTNNTVQIFLDGRLKHQFDGDSWMDIDNRTLEMRARIDLPAELNISQVLDGETFGRKAQKIQIDSLSEMKCVPSLEMFVSRETELKLNKVKPFSTVKIEPT